MLQPTQYRVVPSQSILLFLALKPQLQHVNICLFQDPTIHIPPSMRPDRLSRKTGLLPLQRFSGADSLVSQDLLAPAGIRNKPLKQCQVVIVKDAVAGGVVMVFDDVLREALVADHLRDGGARVGLG